MAVFKRVWQALKDCHAIDHLAHDSQRLEFYNEVLYDPVRPVS